jgi:hypothetical protein
MLYLVKYNNSSLFRLDVIYKEKKIYNIDTRCLLEECVSERERERARERKNVLFERVFF